tara:strand:- start:130 stop:663 length:534 start_codon:yes stop_codon:yes gene_type:complete
MVKNLREFIVLGFTMIVMTNGYVWTNIFERYKDSLKQSNKELILQNQKLKMLVEEHKLEGMDVTVTMYHPVSRQTDSTPNILADGTRIKIHKASEYRYIAVSRNLLIRHGGWLNYGDFIYLKGTGGKDGMYQVRDTMNARFVNRIDILESPGTPPYKYTDAQIMKHSIELVSGDRDS